MSEQQRYREAGVDIAAAEAGLEKIIATITGTWPKPGEFGAPALGIGYFANVIDIGGGTGLAICTDGVGTKSVIADMLNKYDTIGIDCVAMNVNDLICVGARPLSMVDYIAVGRADATMLGAIAAGLAEGARQAGISISGGEIAQLRDVVTGFDLVGMAVGLVPLDRILLGRDLEPGDQVIGIAASGIHANGLSLARRALFEYAGFGIGHVFPELGVPLGEELLRPTLIYVPEALEILGAVPGVKALVNITGDGFLNLPRVAAPVGFVLDNLPRPPAIFELIRRYGEIGEPEMYEVFNMGVGFCVLAAPRDCARILEILARRGRTAQVIGRVVADETKSVRLPQLGLIGAGKHFHHG
jgi:phosphoribosylformylglycinamidine cyclo-ligase